MFDKIKIERKLLKQLDFGMLFTLVLIVVFSIFNIYSAKHLTDGNHYMKMQIIWLFIGLFLVYITLIFDYTLIKNFTPIFYWICIILLILSKFSPFKKVVNGAASWMVIAGISFQPSEFAKLAMILMMAKMINNMEGSINQSKNFFKLAGIAFIPMILILTQPDMGMTMVSFFIVLGIFFIAGLDLRVIGGGLVGIIVSIVIVWNSTLMPQYWKTRLVSFLNPEADELGSGLQLIEALKGIGSGGLLGKGFLKGTQIAGGFIPEAHTDFIFSVVGEEWGLLGGIILLIAYGILIYKIIKIARTSKDEFGTILCVGIVSNFLFAVYQNIGMTIGLAPITGITLPFMSYGGSSMLTSFVALGLVLNVGMRRKKINF